MSQTKTKSRLEREIDENLRRAFEDVSEQEIPDRFAKLLAALKDAETKPVEGDVDGQ